MKYTLKKRENADEIAYRHNDTLGSELSQTK